MDLLLQDVKDRLVVTGNFHDKMLKGYIEDVKQFMLSAGVKEDVIDTPKCVGAIARGVSDLWMTGGFSETFKQRLIQLTFEV